MVLPVNGRRVIHDIPRNFLWLPGFLVDKAHTDVKNFMFNIPPWFGKNRTDIEMKFGNCFSGFSIYQSKIVTHEFA